MLQATFIITNNHETMIHQHKAHDSAILTIIHAHYDMICTIIIRLSTVKKENQVHGNFTNKGWRKASNIINPLCTNKGYACDS